MRLADAAHQAWPPFVLVAGLLLVGVAAAGDGLFAYTGGLLERLPGSPTVLLLAGIGLVGAVTAVLNLDTAVVFLTPVLVYAARARGVDEEPFLYSAIFTANASSLYLPGSNLTNLLVLAHDPVSGGTFAARMLPAALAATGVTAALLVVIFRRHLRAPAQPTGGARRAPRPGLTGLAGTLAAAVLTVVLRNAALAVLGVGVVCVASLWIRRRLSLRPALEAVGPLALAALFAVSVALGVLARSWDGPARALAHAGRVGTAALGALGAIAVNNLPAAVLLSARSLPHPRALLVGLDLGPNVAVTGSLSALLWFRAARALGAHASPVAFTKRGLVLAPAAAAAALAAAALLTSAS